MEKEAQLLRGDKLSEADLLLLKALNESKCLLKEALLDRPVKKRKNPVKMDAEFKSERQEFSNKSKVVWQRELLLLTEETTIWRE